MKLKEVLLLTLLIVLLPVVSAQSLYTVTLNLADYGGMPAYFQAENFLTEKTISGTPTILQDNTLELQLDGGFQKISVGVDNPSTPGFDYYGEVSVNVNNDLEIPISLYAVGSRKITATDRNNKPIQRVPIRIDCDSRRGEQGYFRSDEFGVAESNFLPVGKCVFRAAIDDFVLVSENTIQQGSKEEISIMFDEYPKERMASFWLFVIIIALLVSIIFFLYKRRYNIKPSRLVKDMSKGSASKDDIITALTDTEKKVVRFIMEEQEKHIQKGNKTKDFYLYQARIIYGASVPKTTLVRILQSLEKKSILHIERFGKLKKVRFSDWFDSK